ncbi:MAG: ribose 5-phosphate isomerase B [Candidatus Riflebacteria bacterium HGW-Riflebacteria-2]|jgi:ribose 5-phosphate isomerase B|nr:MAG: ribose 5-phosphate isomerase B [Candidatus Riflebacteria bacterium HGW-Riflebacteria-2]
MPIIYLGADHGGFPHKEELKKHLIEKGHVIEDIGAYSTLPVDYPDIAYLVAASVAKNPHSLGIIIDGAGIGSCMAANKVPGIRAACCNDLYTARNSREHNHANVLTLGSMVIGTGYMKQIVDLWVETTPAPGRHANRVAKIMQLERLTG